MCTLSFVPRPDGYELFFNRDERRSRRPALPPSRQLSGGLSFLAPTDGDHGGTWIAVNASGVALALLNLYGAEIGAHEEEREREGRESRGLLVSALAGAGDLETAVRGVTPERARRHLPFRLLIFAPSEAPVMIRFDGRTLESAPLGPEDFPVVSSAVDPEGVHRARRALFRELRLLERPDTRRLLAFHRSHLPERGARSVCMHRPDARTVSLTRVRVSAGRAVMWYCPDAPCRGRFGPPVDLPLSAGCGPATP